MLIALDTETELAREGDQAPRIVCVQIADDRNETLLHWSECERWVTGILTDPSITIVGHTIAYDMCCIARMFPQLIPAIYAKYEANQIVCTEALAKLKDIELGLYRKFWRGRKINYDLGSLSERYLHYTLNKDNPWRLRFGELRDIPLSSWPVDARTYARGDARGAYDLALALAPWPEDTWRQSRSSFWIRRMSNNGFPVYKPAIDVWEANLIEERDALATTLIDNGFARVTERGKNAGKVTRNAKQTQEYAREWYGLDNLRGETIRETGDPLLIAYADYSAVNKKITTDVKFLRDVDQRVHSYFDPLKDTGRTGSKGPNIQNLDRKSGVRECFRPPNGKVFISADYGKGELCTWSQVCLWMFGRSEMAQVLNAGGDPHLEIAALLAGCSLDYALQHKSDEYIDDRRQVGKVVDFGCPGGMGVDRLVSYAKDQYHVILSRDQAKEAREVWRNRWWEARVYHSYISSLFNADNDPIAITHPVANRVRGGLRYTQACNSFFQGLLADAAKSAGWLIARACDVDRSSPLFGCSMVNFCHDEFVTECPEGDQAHFAAIEQSRLMVEGARPWIPDVTPEAEPLIARVFSKKAKPVFDERKMLIPWSLPE